jgi:putative DNA primase/helicase
MVWPPFPEALVEESFYVSIVAQQSPTRNTPAVEPPLTIPLNLPGIPHAMIEYDHWVLWRWALRTDRNGQPKWTKEPINARTGKLADTTKPDTWAPFSVATYFLEQRGDEVDGIGYVFGDDDPFCGIDLDNARNPETKELHPKAQAIVDRFDSFTERSISGTGAHIIIEGEVPPGGNRRGKIEMYSAGRFFVVSGQVIQNPNLIGDRSEELDVFHREIFPEVYAPKEEQRQPLTSEPLTVADDELLGRCNGNEKFRRLWAGNDSDYGDDTSSADLAFCNIVVRNGGSRDQVDAIYRRSDRARAKWDERRGQSTYGGVTLDEAFDGTVIPFTPGPRLTANGHAGPKPQDAALPPDDLPDDIPSLKAIIIDLRARVVAAEERAAAEKMRADKLSELQSKTTGIIRNKALGQERFTAVALAYQLGNREASGDVGDNGLYRMPLARIAESAGVSEDTASKHLQKLEQEGVIRRKVKWIPQTVNRETGELVGGHNALFVGPASNVTDFVEAVAKLAPEKPKNWGGSRIHCPNHPDADVIKTTTWHCAECGEVLNSETEIIRLTPQDADLPDELAATGTEGASSRAPIPRRGTSTSAVSGAVSHNVEDASRSPVADAWLHGRSIPRAPSPVDLGVTL